MSRLLNDILKEATDLDALLARPSGVDPTLLALLADRFYAERQMETVRQWLGANLRENLDAAKVEQERIENELRTQVTDLQAQVDRLTHTHGLRVVDVEAKEPPPAGDVNAPAS